MYSKDHKLFKAMRKVAISAKASPVVIPCDSAQEAKGIQRIWYDCKRTKDVTFDGLKTKRKGKNITVSLKSDPLVVINDALGKLPSSSDKAESLLLKAVETRPTDFGDPEYNGNGKRSMTAEILGEPDYSVLPSGKKPFTRHAGHFVKGDPRICRDKGMPRGGQDPADRIWSYIVKRIDDQFEENSLRKAISHNKLSYDLIKFNDGLKWLAKENFIVIEGKPGHRRIRVKI